MSRNPNMYSVDPHIAELYDRSENYTDDVELLLRLIGAAHPNQAEPWNIFEPFCGTGRILIPLALAGHQLTGLDQSKVFLISCQEKLASANAQAKLMEGDVICDPWPGGFDLVVMGGNCLYELASAEEQESCIRAAAGALKPGGYLFLDNNHMEGDLAPSWQDMRVHPGFPSGTCVDGVKVESTTQVIWFDIKARLARFQRSTRVIFPNGTIAERTYIQQKHPVSVTEIKGWLEKYGFEIEALYGSRAAEPYSDSSSRAIFWARRST